ncbi:MAG: stalk domain-containing protein [Syntrophomonadaceae bacterium]
MKKRFAVTMILIVIMVFTCVIGVSVASTGVPVGPEWIHAFAYSTTEVDVDWVDKSDNETGFTIYRTVSQGKNTLPVQPVGTTGPNVTKYRDSGLIPNTTYVYEVKAFNAQGTSAPSARTVVTAPTRVIYFYLNQNTYYLNGQTYPMIAPLLLVDNHNYVPLAALVQALGGSCTWDGNTKTIVVKVDKNEVKLVLDSTDAIVNGKVDSYLSKIQCPPIIINGRTYLPLGFMTNRLGCDIWWDQSDQKARIYYPSSGIPGI